MPDQSDVLDTTIFFVDFINQLVRVACGRKMICVNDFFLIQIKNFRQDFRCLRCPEIGAGQDQV
jgi:hypothetical protein